MADWSRAAAREGQGVVRWRRLRLWARQNRLGLWLAVLLGVGGLAYAVVCFTEAMGRYAPSYYEPKDLERQRQWERQGGAR